jgi:hypothetical protein
MERTLANYLPLVTTAAAAVFTVVLFRHWRRRPTARYLMWWTGGVAVYGLGTLAESLTTIFGWSEPVFRLWYIAGALMGGVLLAQGVVYLLVSEKTADLLTRILLVYLTVAIVFVLFVPVDAAAADRYQLSGEVIEWDWVRLFTPVVNIYAVFWLVGGAVWSAWRYFRTDSGTARRVWGNVAIAVGAIMPAMGGSFAKAGHVEGLYATELIGLLLIWAGYRIIVTDPGPSIHAAQQKPTDLTVDLRDVTEPEVVAERVEGPGVDP